MKVPAFYYQKMWILVYRGFKLFTDGRKIGSLFTSTIAYITPISFTIL